VSLLCLNSDCSTVVDFLSGYSEEIWNVARPILTQFPEIVASVIYLGGEGTVADGDAPIPLLRHVAGPAKQGTSKPGKTGSKDYHYPKVKGQWYSAGNADFDYAADSVAHTRNLQFLKPKMGGPYFDLEAIWEEHTYYEFADRSVEHTMSTMVQEPYVNHIPTVRGNVMTCLEHLLTIRQLTGGVGRDNLSVFYLNNFIFNNSADTDLELVSRTIGIDRVIDEFIFKFTHDRELDWL
jgi:carboxymethylenebutenolidase